MDLLVAQCLGTLLEDEVVVVARQALTVAGAGHAQLGFGLFIPGRHLSPVNRPVQKVRPFNGPVGGQRFPFMVLKAQGSARPVGRGAAHSLDDPRRKAGKVLGHAPVAAGGAGIQPGQLAKAFPFVVDVILGQVAPPGLQRHDLDALLRQLVRKDAAPCPGADDDDH